MTGGAREIGSAAIRHRGVREFRVSIEFLRDVEASAVRVAEDSPPVRDAGPGSSRHVAIRGVRAPSSMNFSWSIPPDTEPVAVCRVEQASGRLRSCGPHDEFFRGVPTTGRRGMGRTPPAGRKHQEHAAHGDG